MPNVPEAPVTRLVTFLPSMGWAIGAPNSPVEGPAAAENKAVALYHSVRIAAVLSRSAISEKAPRSSLIRASQASGNCRPSIAICAVKILVSTRNGHFFFWNSGQPASLKMSSFMHREQNSKSLVPTSALNFPLSMSIT